VRTPILRRLTPFSGKESSTASLIIGPATSAAELACSRAGSGAPARSRLVIECGVQPRRQTHRLRQFG
jgi:hypothetical protein